MKRIEWDEKEQDVLFRGAKSLWEQPGNKKKFLHELVRMAQIALSEERHRNIPNIGAVPKGLRSRLEEASIGKLLERKSAGEKSPDQLRIEQLANERDEALAMAVKLQEEVDSLKATIRTYENLPKPPSDMEVVTKFLRSVFGPEAAQRYVGSTMEPLRPPPPIDSARSDSAPHSAPHSAGGNGASQPSKKHNPEYEPAEKVLRPLVIIFGAEPTDIEGWSRKFPEMEIRGVKARADGWVQVPSGGEEVLMVHGNTRHATSAAIRKVYPNARLCLRGEVVNLLSNAMPRLLGK